jgi:hypothetical protein
MIDPQMSTDDAEQHSRVHAYDEKSTSEAHRECYSASICVHLRMIICVYLWTIICVHLRIVTPVR